MKYPIPSPIFDTLEHSELPLSGTNNLAFCHQDFKLAFDFLKQYDGNKATFLCYRKEIERFLQWSWLVEKKSILELKNDDLERYIKFCLSPPRSWIGFKIVSRFKIVNGEKEPNKNWKPFIATLTKLQRKNGDNLSKNGDNLTKNSYKLSQKSIQEIFVTLGSFYNHLISQNISSYNPIASIRQKSKFITKSQGIATVRRLSDIQWQTVVNTAKELALNEPNKHERTLFIISCLYLMYLRVSELVKADRWSPQMNHFYQDSYQNWWFKTVGKGNKERSIAVNDDMLKALIRWRKYLNLSPSLPTPDDTFPLVPSFRGIENISDTKTIYLIVQNCFDCAIEIFKNNNKPDEAISLSKASSHWLRHTGISDAINKYDRPIAHVRDDAGHASINTTDRYNDINLLDRHNSARKSKLEST